MRPVYVLVDGQEFAGVLRLDGVIAYVKGTKTNYVAANAATFRLV